MKFSISTIALLFATFSLASALPKTEDNLRRSCNDGDKYCGKCNGTSCKAKIWGISYNYDCKDGTSCVGNGGGDGTYCGSDAASGPYTCPVST